MRSIGGEDRDWERLLQRYGLSSSLLVVGADTAQERLLQNALINLAIQSTAGESSRKRSLC